MKKILVVDDEKDIRELISISLRSEGFNVDKAASGKAALDVLKADNVDLMLLDIMMPGMDGYATAEKVREFSNVPIIIVSIRADDITDEQKKKFHFSAVIQKPFESTVLLHAVNEAVS
ncbi:MAG: response regulator [Candidatus Nanoarchaeia archaeon]